MEPNLYEILGVSKNASADELKKAHRGLVRKYHPDVNKDPGADAKFKEIQDAYDILSDPEKRKLFDQFGIAGVKAGPTSGAGPRPGPGGNPFGGGGGQSWQNVDPSTFEDVFGSMFGGRGARGGRGRPFGKDFEDEDESPQHGQNAQATEMIDFTTAALGGSRSFRVQGESIDVRIPAGIRNGAKLAVRGKGQRPAGGGSPGDLIITIHVSTHPWFRREDNDILMDVPLSITEAALGTSVRVPLLNGSVQLKVPGGVKSGQRLRVKGKGIQPAKGEAGDFLAVIQIEAPKELPPEAREALEKVAPVLPAVRTGQQWKE